MHAHIHMHPTVVYEDKNLVAVNKPAGLLVHEARSVPARRSLGVGGKREARGGHQEATLVDWLLARYPEVRNVGDDPKVRPGIVHRLDRDTSGIMIVAKTQESFEYLKSLFERHEVKKIYLALVRGVPKEKSGTIDAPIGMKNGTVKRSVHGGRMVKEAVTEYRVKKIYGEGAQALSLLEVRPQTGRTHQIRVHLASIGHPIAGDTLYGKKEKRNKKREMRNEKSPPRLVLHAFSLEFPTEAGHRLVLEAELPGDFNRFLKALEVR